VDETAQAGGVVPLAHLFGEAEQPVQHVGTVKVIETWCRSMSRSHSSGVGRCAMTTV